MTLVFETALLTDGWHDNVAIGVADGVITDVEPDASGETVRGAAVPGMPNLHSHAFQRAMAGLAERASGDFWSWRQVMYAMLARLGPDEIGAIAAQLYVEMLKAGYTAVGEFHYLHHAPDGSRYATLSETSVRVIEAARTTGIAITHLPVLYAHGGFGAVSPTDQQRRFVNDFDRFVKLVSELRDAYDAVPSVHIGIASHSLRAVSPELLRDAVDLGGPIHIHIAEQPQEVEDCIAWSGARPVAWLLDHADVDARWCLVHATHMDAEETAALARSGAVVGLCPTTEANLGDGIFLAADYVGASGRFGIGSDSHVAVDVAEELRLLEYGQRLTLGRRAVLAAPEASTGRSVYERTVTGGATALGLAAGRLAPGHRADIVVLDTDHPTLVGRSGDAILDSWVFCNAGRPVRDVYVGGVRVVADGTHRAEDAVLAGYRATIADLTP